MVSSSHDCPIALELLELYWNSFDHIFLIIHSLCKLMVRALFLMFLSLVYCRDPFLACCYFQCTHPLLARLLDVNQCFIIFMLMTLSYTLRSGRLLFLIWIWVQCDTKLINCVQDMDVWMLSNEPKLNKDKSEVLVISSRFLSTSDTTIFFWYTCMWWDCILLPQYMQYWSHLWSLPLYGTSC